MTWLEALILGVIQGLTEFLPVSSSGHLEIGKALLGIEPEQNLTFTVVVHGATVLSTIIVFRRDIGKIFLELFEFKWNDSAKYVTKIIISMIPIGIVGVFFKEEVESFFTGNLILVGSMLLVTALLLTFTYFAKNREKNVSYLDSIIIGIAQAMAVIPGISRSGSTIATGLLLGNKRENVARFSFLMVLIPIIGANLKDLADGTMQAEQASLTPLVVGFIAAFLSGWMACKWMINIVKKGKLIYFAAYCFLVGLIAIIFG